MSTSPSKSCAIPTRTLQLKDWSQLPDCYSQTPGGPLFSTTPGGKLCCSENNPSYVSELEDLNLNSFRLVMLYHGVYCILKIVA